MARVIAGRFIAPDRQGVAWRLLEAYLARSSVKLRPVVESNSFEFLRGCLQHGHAISFQIAIGATLEGGDIVAREILDRGFPSGHLVLARLRMRQLPVISHAFAEHLRSLLERATV